MHASTVFYLGIKEFRSLARDRMMVVLIIYAFSVAIYIAGTVMPEPLHKAPIAIVDEDRSPLSARIADAFFAPMFLPAARISAADMDRRMDRGLDTFALDIPPDFQRDVLAGHRPALQLNVDATRISQAFTGSGYIQLMISAEIDKFVNRRDVASVSPLGLVVRNRFNPELNKTWFGAVMELVNNITMLSIILTGAALIREREHGTVEHLLVMPVTPAEIMASKVWSMGLVALLATALSLRYVVQAWLAVPISGSMLLFLSGAALHLFATTSMGIFLATVARSMPQFGLLLLLVLLPLEILSGALTPRESMPALVQTLMLAAPTTHFVAMAQAVLYRGAGLGIVWPQMLGLLAIGSVLFGLALLRFRSTLASMA
jgi:ABC-2 type transport system permease protein